MFFLYGLDLGPWAQILGPGPKFWTQGPNFGPRGPNLSPWAQISAQGPKSGGPRARAPSFPKRYFLETRIRILTTPTFKKEMSPEASKPFPEGAPRKTIMFEARMARRSSDMSISCPDTIFFSPKRRDSGCGFFRVLTFQEHKLLTCQEPGMLGVGNPFSDKMFQKHLLLHGLGAGVVHKAGSSQSRQSSGNGPQLAVRTLGYSRLRPG